MTTIESALNFEIQANNYYEFDNEIYSALRDYDQVAGTFYYEFDSNIEPKLFVHVNYQPLGEVGMQITVLDIVTSNNDEQFAEETVKRLNKMLEEYNEHQIATHG